MYYQDLLSPPKFLVCSVQGLVNNIFADFVTYNYLKKTQVSGYDIFAIFVIDYVLVNEGIRFCVAKIENQHLKVD